MKQFPYTAMTTTKFLHSANVFPIEMTLLTVYFTLLPWWSAMWWRGDERDVNVVCKEEREDIRYTKEAGSQAVIRQ